MFKTLPRVLRGVLLCAGLLVVSSTGLAQSSSSTTLDLTASAAAGQPQELYVQTAQASSTPSTTVYMEQGQLARASQNVTALGADLMGDRVNLYTGALEFNHTDVSLPGNSGLAVALNRRLTAGRSEMVVGHFGNWDLDIPRLQGVFTASNGWVNGAGAINRCSWYSQPPTAMGGSNTSWWALEYWQGNTLQLPGGGGEEILTRAPANTATPTDGHSYPLVTRGGWQFRCLPSLASGAGEGFLAVAPDGTQYRFDWMASRYYPSMRHENGALLLRREVWLMPTLITDRFGNTVTYSYDPANPWKLLRIEASDGRYLQLGYAPLGNTVAVQSVSDGIRTWNYDYSAAGELERVRQPDGSNWQFNLSGLVRPLTNEETGATCNWAGAVPSGTYSGTITHPSGAVGQFVTAFTMHGRAGVDKVCRQKRAQPDAPTFAQWPHQLITQALSSKTISGPGLGNQTWSYGSSSVGSWAPCNGCNDKRIVTVTDPQGHVTRHVYGNLFRVNEGQLLRQDQGWNGSTALRSTSYAYQSPSGMSYPEPVGISPSEVSDDLASRHRPQHQRVITQQGTSFSWTANSFDSFARPTSVTRTGPSGSRSETISYFDQTSRWVLGQTDAIVSGGMTVLDHDYDTGTALPTAIRKFGVLQQSYTYHADGTVATVSDGKSQTTHYSDYKRGLAQRIDHADGSTQSAQVNDIGLITSLTDAAGYTTGYSYDEIGRLEQVTPPAGWNATSIVFEPVAGSEYGLSSGHWRQTISRGNARTISYFDALWRPVMTRTFDAADEASTRKVVVRGFDVDGRKVYESYPQRDAASVSSSLPAGTRTAHDALGRAFRSEADSELGVLTSTTDYLDGFQTRTINPRAKVTTQGFWALDNPDEAALATVAAPAGVNLSIVRDAFGKPTAITRSGLHLGAPISVTRRYVYDGGQRLCKTIEPELGASVQDYDGAGNLAWRAPGQSLPNASECDRASVAAAAKIAYGYDALNRLTSTAYGDGSPSISRSYWPDGKLRNVSTSSGSSWSYAYNALRLLSSETLGYGGSSHELSRSYDSNGNLSALVYPSGGPTLTYSPNALGEPRSVGAYASAISFHPNGAVEAYRLGNGIQHTQSQNLRGLPLLNRDAGVVQDLYAYDANGNVSSITDQQENHFHRTLGYDDLDRLISANAPNVWGNASYSYDPIDNLRSATVGSRSSTLNYDATNRLSSVTTNGGTTSYGYDALGNLRSKGLQTFTFDIGNRLSSASLGGSYVYDGHGRRIKIVSTDGSTRLQAYSQDGQLLWAQRSGGASVPAVLVYECPAGTTLSGDRCLGSSSVSATLSYSCPAGYTLSGSQCSQSTQSSSPATLSYSCPGGYTLSGSECLSSSSVAAMPIYACPASYQLSGSSCSRPTVNEATASYSCKGYVNTDPYSPGYCFTTYVAGEIDYEAVANCQVEANARGLRYGQVQRVYEGLYRCYLAAAISYSCPAGAVLNGSQCMGTEVQNASIASYSCSSGSLVGSSCVTTTASPASASYSCPSGQVLSGQTCYASSTHTIAAQANYSCPGGYVLQPNNSCLASSNIAATSRYTCPQGGTVSGSQCLGGTSWTYYIHLGGKQIAETGAGVTQYVHTDALGSPVAHSNAAGGILNRSRYEPYGYVAQGTKPSPATSVIGFTGHVQDAETDLVYMQQRYYDPIAGRFLSVDPVVTDANNGKSFGRYHYAENKPYTLIDPDGMQADDPANLEARLAGRGGGAGLLGARGIDGGPIRQSVEGSRANLGEARASIQGNAQVTRSGGTETTHASTSQRLANEAARSADAKSVHMNQTISTVTGGKVNSAVRPDVATVRQDGKVNVTEVLSPGQSSAAQIRKNQNALGNLAGEIKAVPPDPKLK
ncbi:RHS repeat-associated core domain-containing protein [Paucibacter sp. M5-1]|uniref:RHS repeat-associated core domain-containing protein n=1 Tax=Paucibacter sp. M5-1 TaxID=3015998 RepID=UPI0022B92FC5|nr:RHS repeat-associated core domain-containing protein [Paucibacter sp. M5-1]MCZ7882271.1 hypothetical protein [Paucibacter sp. M5-1]